MADFFAGLEGRFRPEKAAGLRAVYQFVITGEGGGRWIARVDGSTCTVAEGEAYGPDITIRCDAADWLAIVEGRQSPQAAFAARRLTVEGDMGLALRLQPLFL